MYFRSNSLEVNFFPIWLSADVKFELFKLQQTIKYLVWLKRHWYHCIYNGRLLNVLSILNIITCNSSNVNLFLPTTFLKHLLHNETSLFQKPLCQGALAKLKPQNISLFEQNTCVSSALNSFQLLDMKMYVNYS